MLKVSNLCKHYPSFDLKDVSFEVERGYITGFIGENGAGKSTTMKCIMNLVKPDSGSVEILGKDFYTNEEDLKEKIAFNPGAFDYYPKTKIKSIVKVYKSFFKEWDEDAYRKYMAQFSLDENKKVSELSAGMKVKLGITLALSHNAELIILDEPTSGLDPVARDEIVDVFRSIVESGERSVLFSTHITSDLDKCADYIVFIHQGEIVMKGSKDDILESHLLVRGKTSDLERMKSKVINVKKNAFGFTALVKKCDYDPSDGLDTAVPNLEELMVYYCEKEETANA